MKQHDGALFNVELRDTFLNNQFDDAVQRHGRADHRADLIENREFFQCPAEPLVLFPQLDQSSWGFFGFHDLPVPAALNLTV